MDRDGVMEWLDKNLDRWPDDINQFINIPSYYWRFMASGLEIIAVNELTGEMIGKFQFFNYRYENRFTPCGLPYAEMMNQIFKV